MKKKILIILGILIVVCLAVCGIIFYNKSLEYTVEETKELVKKGSNLPEEIYLKTEYFDNEGNTVGWVESFQNGKLKHIKQASKDEVVLESFLDEEAKTFVIVFHENKQLDIKENYPIDEESENSNEFIYSIKRNEKYAHLGIYEYLGREKVNNRKCIKVSLTDNDKDGITATNYYIDIETGYILKQENVVDGKVESSIINTFDVNKVNGENLKFEKEKYSDYEVISDIEE